MPEVWWPAGKGARTASGGMAGVVNRDLGRQALIHHRITCLPVHDTLAQLDFPKFLHLPV